MVARHGHPPLWAREPTFQTLVLIILEQQVSLASARAAYRRLEAAVSVVEPARVATMSDAAAIAAGLTRQKRGYLSELAARVLSGELDLDAVAAGPDDAARTLLTIVPGIGRWSGDVYLLMALGRPDVWPIDDIALAASARAVKRLSRRPSPDELAQIGKPWRPWRSAAARLLWHAYLARDRASQREGG
ncbi:MAG: DNA-3-methyladenine glycosylase [Candidatus Limnocylindria bacterium]